MATSPFLYCVSFGGASTVEYPGPPLPVPSGSPPWITKPGTMRWNVRPSKKPFFTRPSNEAVVQGEIFAASSYVKLPLLVSTTTEFVWFGSRSARSAFDLSPPISQFIELPPEALLSLFLSPPHPTSRTTTGRRTMRRFTRRPRGHGGRALRRSRPCTRCPEAASRRRGHWGSRAPTESALRRRGRCGARRPC